MAFFKVTVTQVNNSKQVHVANTNDPVTVVLNDNDFDNAYPVNDHEFEVVMKDGGRLLCEGTIDSLMN